ncbi:Bug family tripartite tricarboxylate transporter substrate binding protein [Variovorax defluvii]
MQRVRRRIVGAVLCCCALGAVAQQGTQIPFGSKPIRILVGYAPGGGADLIARVYGQKLQEALGVPVVVENKPGAFEQLAAQPVTMAAPDGHTLWLGTSGALTMGPGVRTNIPYDIVKSFTHVAKLGEVNAVLTVKKSLPVNNLQEFIAYAKARPGQLNYASAGVGAGNHLLTEYIMALTGISMTHVPYKGDADVVREVAAGNADFGIPTVATGTPFINDGRIKPLVVTGNQRAKALANVPALNEENVADALKNYGVYAIYAVLGPAGMPAAVTRKLNEEFTRISRMPDVVAQLENGNVRASSSTPDDLRQFIEKDVAKWREVGKRIKLD